MGAFTMIVYRATRGKAKWPPAPLRRARAGVRSYALAVSATKGAA